MLKAKVCFIIYQTFSYMCKNDVTHISIYLPEEFLKINECFVSVIKKCSQNAPSCSKVMLKSYWLVVSPPHHFQILRPQLLNRRTHCRAVQRYVSKCTDGVPPGMEPAGCLHPRSTRDCLPPFLLSWLAQNSPWRWCRMNSFSLLMGCWPVRKI